MIRILTISTLYPNSQQPRHGIFVETRLHHLLEKRDMTATVIAPVPWFPLKLKWFDTYSRFADIPQHERRKGLDVYHPRYLVIPKIGMLLTPFFLGISIWLQQRKLRRNGQNWDLIDGHYYFPDGVALALFCRWLGSPLLITARGTDINLIPENRIARGMILWAAGKAFASITVCSALKERMVELGAREDKIHVLRNGVDLELFRPLSKSDCRIKWNMQKTTLLSVGHLIERKGHHHVICALAHLDNVELLIAGDGEQEQALKELAAEIGVSGRVRFLGALSQEQLVEVYSGADIMVLASSREGWANVLLESMACGTPVVATNIWGTPEVVAEKAAGILVDKRDGAAIAEAVSALLEDMPERGLTRAYAEQFSWADTAEELGRLMRQAVLGSPAGQRE